MMGKAHENNKARLKRNIGVLTNSMAYGTRKFNA